MLNEVTDVAGFLNLLYLKLSPWFKIKILTVTPWSVSFSIGEFDELFAMCDSGWKLQTTSNKPGTQGAASRHFANHLNGILSGSVRDDAGNLTARDISVFREDARRRSIEVVRTTPEGFRLLSYEPRMSSDCYWSLGCKDWVLIGNRVEAANRDMWPAIRIVANEAEPVKQFVLVFDGENDQALYVDGLLKNTDSTLYACDIADAANGCTVKIEVRDVKVSGSWAKKLSDLVTEDATCKQTLQVQPDHIADANKKVDPSPSEEKPKDRTVFMVGDPVVTFNGRRGSIEAFGLIEDFPITVRHSKRETVSYRLGDVWLDTDAKPVVKESLTAEPEPAPKKYRTPTILDLSNGPIRCEVFDDEDEVWTKRWLTFVSDRRAFPFVTVDPENKDKSGSWKRCRIEAAFDPVTDLSQTAARIVGKAIDQMIHSGEPVKPPQPDPVIKKSLISELAVGDRVRIIRPGHHWKGVVGYITAITASKDYPYEFNSHLLVHTGYFQSSDLERIEPSNCPEIPDSSSGATGNPPKTLNAARDLSSQFWEEAYQIMIALFNSGLSVGQIKQELLSRLPEGASGK